MVGDEVDHSSPRQRCYDPVEARSVLPDLWKIPAAEKFPTRGFEAGLENGCIRTTVHGDERQIFPDAANEDCTVKLRAAIKKALNPPLSFGGCGVTYGSILGKAWGDLWFDFGRRAWNDLRFDFGREKGLG